MSSTLVRIESGGMAVGYLRCAPVNPAGLRGTMPVAY